MTRRPNALTAEELRYLDSLVRAALPIDPSHQQWSPERRAALSRRLLRLLHQEVRL